MQTNNLSTKGAYFSTACYKKQCNVFMKRGAEKLTPYRCRFSPAMGLKTMQGTENFHVGAANNGGNAKLKLRVIALLYIVDAWLEK